MTLILHMSDPHFGTVQSAVEDALVMLARVHQPDILVLSGDITQRATVLQFTDAQAFCQRLAIPRLLALPGNHDIPLFNLRQRLFTPYARYQQAFGTDMEPSIDTPEALLIGVNTTRWWRHKNGDVSLSQIKRVADQLRRASDQPDRRLRAVVVHQPVHVLRSEDEHDRLRNWAPAVQAWSEAGADLILGGHIHLPYVCELSSATPGLASMRRSVWCVQAGTSLSSRIRQEAPNSVNLIRMEPHAPSTCAVERWDFKMSLTATTGEFVQVHTTHVGLDARS